MPRKRDLIDWTIDDIRETYFIPLVENGEMNLNDSDDFAKFMRIILLAQQNNEL